MHNFAAVFRQVVNLKQRAAAKKSLFSSVGQRQTETGGYQSGQMGQTVNLLVFTFGGSNPSPPTLKRTFLRK